MSLKDKVLEFALPPGDWVFLSFVTGMWVGVVLACLGFWWGSSP